MNTLSNAIRFSNDGAIEISLDSSYQIESQCELHIRVLNWQGKLTSQPSSSVFQEYAQNSNEYYGAGLGLTGSKELASALGGEFSFHRDTDGNFVTDIRIPCERADNDIIEGILYPVVLVTRDEDLASRVRGLLANETNVIVISRVEDFRSRIAALLIDVELTRFRGYLTLLEGGFHDAHNTNCLSTGLPATDDRTGTGGPQLGRPGTRV